MSDMGSRTSWEWRASAEYADLLELFDGDRMLAWIQKRPYYCDRGHWMFNCNVPGLDGQDSFPRYFMRLETAKQEAVEFLNWRLNKIPAIA